MSSTRIFEIVSGDYSPSTIQFAEKDLNNSAPSRDILNTSKGYIVVSGGGNYVPRIVYVWVGMSGSPELKKNALAIGFAYIQQSGYPFITPLRKIGEENPSKEFRAEFLNWKTNFLNDISDARSMLLIKSPAKTSFTAEELSNTDVAEGGSVKIWRVDGVKRVNLPKEKYGHFYSQDCYVLLYTFSVLRKDEYIIFYWMGAQASTEDKETTLLLARFMEESLEGSPVQIRVIEGQEPPFFRRLFRGSMIIHGTITPLQTSLPKEKKSGGGVLSIFSRPKPTKETNLGVQVHTSSRLAAGAMLSKLLEKGGTGNALYIVQGTSALTTFARKVALSATVLTSVNCFILDTVTNVYVRFGRQTTEAENQMATNIGNILGASVRGSVEKSIIRVNEGTEPDDFWKALGGKKDYATGLKPQRLTRLPTRDAKLFLATAKAGQLRFVEVDNYKIDDLVDDEIFILDNMSEAIVWVGESVSPQDKDIAIDFAVRLNKDMASVDGRSPDSVVVKVQSGYEKLIFTQHFSDWREDSTPKADEFQKTVLKELLSLNKKPDSKAEEENYPASTAEAPSTEIIPAKATTAQDSSTVTNGKQESEPVSILPSSAKVAARLKSAVPAVEYDYKPRSEPKEYKYEPRPVEELKRAQDGIDVTRKEYYLDDLVFQEMFGMTKQDFDKLPKWKQHAKKKVVGLF